MGETYPLPPVRQILSTTVSFLYIFMILIAVAGRFIPVISSQPFYEMFR